MICAPEWRTYRSGFLKGSCGEASAGRRIPVSFLENGRKRRGGNAVRCTVSFCARPLRKRLRSLDGAGAISRALRPGHGVTRRGALRGVGTIAVVLEDAAELELQARPALAALVRPAGWVDGAAAVLLHRLGMPPSYLCDGGGHRCLDFSAGMSHGRRVAGRRGEGVRHAEQEPGCLSCKRTSTTRSTSSVARTSKAAGPVMWPATSPVPVGQGCARAGGHRAGRR